MQETWVHSLVWEDPPGKETATHSSIPAWRTPGTEEPGGLQAMESQMSWTRLRYLLTTTTLVVLTKAGWFLLNEGVDGVGQARASFGLSSALLHFSATVGR